MCTAILSIRPGAPVLLAGYRDELVDRPWQPPGRHWADYPGLIGGRDLQAGGTWLAVAPQARRVACVLNGRGTMAAAGTRRTRGVLPLQAAQDGKLDRDGLAAFDPFHLLSADPDGAVLWSWDGADLVQRDLAAGLHLVVNSGLAGQDEPIDLEHERSRIEHFLPRFNAARRPDPQPSGPVGPAWGAWLPLLNGDGLAPGDPHALIVRRALDGGRIWGTTSVSLVALGPAGLRYDFTAAPGDPAGWYQVPVEPR
jgi:hypothetical protein